MPSSQNHLSLLTKGVGELKKNGHERIDVVFEPEDYYNLEHTDRSFDASLHQKFIGSDLNKSGGYLSHREQHELHLPKTFVTRKGALLLFSEDFAFKTKLTDRYEQQEEEDQLGSLQTVEDFTRSVLSYGSKREEVNLKFTYEREKGKRIRPGYSAKRYLSRLTKNFDDSFLDNLLSKGYVYEKTLFHYNSLMPHLRQRINDDLSAYPTPYRLLRQMLMGPGILSGFTFYKSDSGSDVIQDVEEGKDEGRSPEDKAKVKTPPGATFGIMEIKDGVAKPVSYTELDQEKKAQVLGDLLVKSVINQTMEKQKELLDQSLTQVEASNKPEGEAEEKAEAEADKEKEAAAKSRRTSQASTSNWTMDMAQALQSYLDSNMTGPPVESANIGHPMMKGGKLSPSTSKGFEPYKRKRVPPSDPTTPREYVGDAAVVSMKDSQSAPTESRASSRVSSIGGATSTSHGAQQGFASSSVADLEEYYLPQPPLSPIMDISREPTFNKFAPIPPIKAEAKVQVIDGPFPPAAGRGHRHELRMKPRVFSGLSAEEEEPAGKLDLDLSESGRATPEMSQSMREGDMYRRKKVLPGVRQMRKTQSLEANLNALSVTTGSPIPRESSASGRVESRASADVSMPNLGSMKGRALRTGKPASLTSSKRDLRDSPSMQGTVIVAPGGEVVKVGESVVLPTHLAGQSQRRGSGQAPPVSLEPSGAEGLAAGSAVGVDGFAGSQPESRAASKLSGYQNAKLREADISAGVFDSTQVLQARSVAPSRAGSSSRDRDSSIEDSVDEAELVAVMDGKDSKSTSAPASKAPSAPGSKAPSARGSKAPSAAGSKPTSAAGSQPPSAPGSKAASGAGRSKQPSRAGSSADAAEAAGSSDREQEVLSQLSQQAHKIAEAVLNTPGAGENLEKDAQILGDILQPEEDASVEQVQEQLRDTLVSVVSKASGVSTEEIKDAEVSQELIESLARQDLSIGDIEVSKDPETGKVVIQTRAGSQASQALSGSQPGSQAVSRKSSQRSLIVDMPSAAQSETTIDSGPTKPPGAEGLSQLDVINYGEAEKQEQEKKPALVKPAGKGGKGLKARTKKGGKSKPEKVAAEGTDVAATAASPESEKSEKKEEFVVGKPKETKELEELYAPLEEPPKKTEKKPRVPPARKPSPKKKKTKKSTKASESAEPEPEVEAEPSQVEDPETSMSQVEKEPTEVETEDESILPTPSPVEKEETDIDFVVVRDEFEDEEEESRDRSDAEAAANMDKLKSILSRGNKSELDLDSDATDDDDGKNRKDISNKEARAAKRAAQAAKRREEQEKKRKEKEEKERKAKEEEELQEKLQLEMEAERKRQEEEHRLKKIKQAEEKKRREEAEKAQEDRKRLESEKEKRLKDEYNRKLEETRLKQQEEEIKRKEQEEQRRIEEEEARKKEEEMMALMEEEERIEYEKKKKEEEEERLRREEEKRIREEEEAARAMEEARKLAEEIARQKAEYERRLQFHRTLIVEREGYVRTQEVSRAFVYSYFEFLQWAGLEQPEFERWKAILAKQYGMGAGGYIDQLRLEQQQQQQQGDGPPREEPKDNGADHTDKKS